MSQRDPLVAFRHMLDHAKEATGMLARKKRSEFAGDRILVLAVTRLLEIIGEAAGRIPRQTQEGFPRIQWTSIYGMRNRIIHGYDNINMEIVWNVVKNDLPLLIGELEAIVRGSEKDGPGT